MSKRINYVGTVEQESDERATKRRKFPSGISDGTNDETAETTTSHGLELLEIIKKTTDKNGRLIATDFLTLPSKRLLPDYYHVIKMPIALDTVESKLKRREFPNLASLENYLNRMILNAKEYNAKGSIVYDDSERLRKTISGYMNKYDPVNKKTSGNAILSLPVPPGKPTRVVEGSKEATKFDDQVNKSSRRSVKNHQALRSSSTPGIIDTQYSNQSFEGLSFQQAQEKIVEDLITEKEYEEDDFSAFEPFIKLPSRKEYKDYYNIVTHPIALKDLQKAVKGLRLKTPGISEFKTWSAFEEEAAYIWKNAYLYNEDNSDIFKLAMDLQAFFNKLIKKAKAAVPEPVSTKIKLRLPEPPKITLKIGKKPSPVSPPPPPTPLPSQLASHITHSQASPITTPNLKLPGTLPNPVSVAQPERIQSSSGPAPSLSPTKVTITKVEEVVRNIPSTTLQNRSSSATTHPVMPPPTTPLSNTNTLSGYSQSYFHQSQQKNVLDSNTNALSGYSQSYFHQSSQKTMLDSRFRQSGNDAMITNLSIATHPGLNISCHFRMDLPPSAALAQQSVTINLPATHYYLQIKPSISPTMMQRQYKLFVTAGTTRLHAMPTIPGHPVEPRNPLFEARLHPGVNRIEFELVAAVTKDSRVSNDIELEKISLYVNLMKA